MINNKSSDVSFDSGKLIYTSTWQNKIIAFEGVSGAGKTSILSSLAEDLEGICIFLSEINLEPYSSEANLSSEGKEGIFHKLWVERIKLLREFKPLGLCFLLDRSYFSNLAYLYALDSIKGTSHYLSYKKTFEQAFSSNDLDLTFVLDIPPEMGLKRRQLRGDNISWPWSDLFFLEALGRFYKEELPKLTRGKIKYIKTNKGINFLKKEIKLELLEILDRKKTFAQLYIPPNDNQLQTLYAFAERNKLGKTNTRLINVLGRPTLYFLKHSIQLEQGQPVFFNNYQLSNILCKCIF